MGDVVDRIFSPATWLKCPYRVSILESTQFEVVDLIGLRKACPNSLEVKAYSVSPEIVFLHLLLLQFLDEETYPSSTGNASIYFTHCLAPEMDIAILRYTVTIKSCLIIIYFVLCSILSLFYQ